MARSTLSTEGGFEYLMFWCEPCKTHHRVRVNCQIHPRWEWNGNLDLPTVKPSVLVTYNGKDAMKLCHSHVTDGRIQYLSDCSHHLAGQTVDLEEID